MVAIAKPLFEKALELEAAAKGRAGSVEETLCSEIVSHVSQAVLELEMFKDDTNLLIYLDPPHNRQC